jgi:hypothetical protein
MRVRVSTEYLECVSMSEWVSMEYLFLTVNKQSLRAKKVEQGVPCELERSTL